MKVNIQNDRQLCVGRTASKGQFKAYHLVPVPIPINTEKLIYITTAKSILFVDKTRQYYYISYDIGTTRMQRAH